MKRTPLSILPWAVSGSLPAGRGLYVPGFIVRKDRSLLEHTDLELTLDGKIPPCYDFPFKDKGVNSEWTM
jgi:hypothetical protein